MHNVLSQLRLGLSDDSLDLDCPSKDWLARLRPKLELGPNPNFGDFSARELRSGPAVAPPDQREIVAGKNTYVYDAHTYHTKVPPEGIKELIEHYTQPGDVVLDPFCGSGMTGVAATELGRKALLSDLSPAAAFIAYNLCTPLSPSEYWQAVQKVLRGLRPLEEELYTTECRLCGEPAIVEYVVWSHDTCCSECDAEFVLWDVARDERATVRESKILKEFDCPTCGARISKRKLRKGRLHPVQIGYKCCEGGREEQKVKPSDADLESLARIDREGCPKELWFPTVSFPDGVNTRQAIAAGISSVDAAYTQRALWAMAALWDSASRWDDPQLASKLLFTVTSLYKRVTKFSEFRFWGGSGNTANWNVPWIINEQNVFRTFERKAKTIMLYFKSAPSVDRHLRVSTQSATVLPQLADGSVDFIFTDPPFGSNINYSEMNYLWESWLGAYTDNSEEAIINRVQGKSASDYTALMSAAFKECRRVLRDGGWAVVVFHNSSASVWRSMQQAIEAAGLDIVATQTFDKRHGTFKQFVSDNAVGYDLVLHCCKNDRIGQEGSGDRHKPEEFIAERIEQAADRYKTSYLHVSRAPEFDYRRLYAEWLTHAVRSNPITLDFEKFRELADSILTAQELLDSPPKQG